MYLIFDIFLFYKHHLPYKKKTSAGFNSIFKIFEPLNINQNIICIINITFRRQGDPPSDNQYLKTKSNAQTNYMTTPTTGLGRRNQDFFFNIYIYKYKL